MLPLPNCFSIVDTATSIAFSRSGSRSRALGAPVSSFSASLALSASRSRVFSVVVVAMCGLPLRCQFDAKRGP